MRIVDRGTDIGEYTVVWTLSDDPNWPAPNFECYEVISTDSGEPMYEMVGDEIGQTNDPENATTALHGFIKWDDCGHFEFGDSDAPGYLHLCGAKSGSNLSKLIGYLFSRSRELWGDKHIDGR